MGKIILLSFIFICSMGIAKKHLLQIAEGRFVKVDHGDYMHLILMDDKNKEISFICSNLSQSLVKGIDCNNLEAKPTDFKDRILKVTYHNETNFIPEAQKKITWKYADRIDFKK